MPITIYPGSMKKRNANGSYSDLVPAIATDPEVLDDFAEEYSISETYNIGDYCIHNSDLYKCNTNNTTGTWNNNAWDRVTVGDELAVHKNTLNQLDGRVDSTQSDIAIILQDPAQDTFTEGTYLVYNNQLYTANQNIPQDTPASSYYPNMLTAVTDGGLNSVYTTILSRFSGIEVPYFGVFIAGGNTYDFQLGTGWSTYLVFSTYAGRFGVWMLISANGNNAKLSGSYNGLSFTNMGSGIIRVSASDTTCITIVRIGVS